MKKILPFIAFAILSCAAFTGCYKQTVYPNSVSATIDSIGFSASGKTAVTYIVDTTQHGYPQMVTISATTNVYIPGTATLPSITLFIPTVPGTYSIPSQAHAIVVTSATGSGGSSAVSGQVIVLTNKSGRVQGDFNFTAADGTNISNGQFTGVLAFY